MLARYYENTRLALTTTKIFTLKDLYHSEFALYHRRRRKKCIILLACNVFVFWDWISVLLIDTFSDTCVCIFLYNFKYFNLMFSCVLSIQIWKLKNIIYGNNSRDCHLLTNPLLILCIIILTQFFTSHYFYFLSP